MKLFRRVFNENINFSQWVNNFVLEIEILGESVKKVKETSN